MIKIGHARSSENGGKYGKAGDQTGNEVSITDIYDKGWNFIFREKNPETRKKIAERAIEICKNDCVGYSQSDRLSLWAAYQVYGSFAAIDIPCNCDCSSMVAAVLNSLDIKVSPDMYTGIEYTEIMDTGRFTAYMVQGEDYSQMETGDILLAAGHTAVVVTSDNINALNNYGKELYAKTDVYIRKTPEKNGQIVGVVHEGECFNFSGIVINGFGLGIYFYDDFGFLTGYTSIKYYGG